MELEKERAVFEANIETWRKDQMGRFVLIKGDEAIGFFDSLDSAFGAGSERFGLEDFFIQQILPDSLVNVSFVGQPMIQ